MIAATLPLAERIHGSSVRLDEIYMGGGDGDLEIFSAEMRHGEWCSDVYNLPRISG